MIRQAKKTDAVKLSELMYIIWHDMQIPLVENNSKEKVLKIIQQSIEEGNYRNHYKNMHVYEVEGNIAGFINCYSGDEEKQLEDNWHNIDFKEEFKLEGTPLPEKEANEGDLYIESIAVFSDYRGRGIATKLIDYIFDYGRNQGYKTVTLNCEVDNEGAMKLYRNLGFEPLHGRVLSGHDYKYMVKNI